MYVYVNTHTQLSLPKQACLVAPSIEERERRLLLTVACQKNRGGQISPRRRSKFSFFVLSRPQTCPTECEGGGGEVLLMKSTTGKIPTNCMCVYNTHSRLALPPPSKKGDKDIRVSWPRGNNLRNGRGFNIESRKFFVCPAEPLCARVCLARSGGGKG